MVSEFFFVILILSTALPLIHVINATIERKKCPIEFYRKEPVINGFSILVPCYNESLILESTLNGLQQLDYENYEIIFINDGSTDDTMKKICQRLDFRAICYTNYNKRIQAKQVRGIFQSNKYPNMFLIDKENGGKADALNTGINLATKDLVVTLDADSILDINALKIVNDHFQNPQIIAAGGAVQILQAKNAADDGLKKSLNLPFIVKSQVLEYLKAFYIYKKSLSKFRAITIISGAFGIFKREILFEIDGFDETLGEDIDITLRTQKFIKKNPEHEIIYIPEAVCYTECPETWSDLFKQRVRWQKAFIDCFFKHGWFLTRNFFKCALGFFILIEGIFFSTICLYLTYISMFFLIWINNFDLNYVFGLLTTYFVRSIILYSIYTFFTLKAPKNFGIQFTSKWELTKAVTFDIFIFHYIVGFFIMWGSFMYIFSRKNWNKVTRTGRVYFKQGKQVGVSEG